MTESSDLPPSIPPEDEQRPAASLANVKIRRRDAAEQDPAAPKPGDLTQVLARRRETSPGAEATAAPNQGTPETGAATSPGDPAEPGTAGATDPAPEAAIDQSGGVHAPPPPPNGPTLRDRLTAQRMTTGATGTKQQPVETADPPVESHATSQPIVAGTNERREPIPPTPQPAPPQTLPAPPEPAGPVAASSETPDENQPFRAAPIVDRDPEPDEATQRRGRRGKKRDKDAGDAVLRKRMASVLKAETRRREEAASRPSTPAAQEPEPGPADTVAAAPRWSAPQKPADIFRFWTMERRGREFPALSELDLDHIATNWPDSLLLRVAPGSKHMELEKSFTRNMGQDQQTPGQSEQKIDYTPAVIDWVLSQGQVVAREGAPVRAMEEFETDQGFAVYRVVALPLGEDGTTIDHILCHLEFA